ncbi:hypothetical protein [Aequorivita sp. KMM 9714]|uniref:hypothetical protein n=1 Tax=Aequorivita sp. KMM 9714 TaxID=2707173 RepID=UPI0013E9B131|nr:hypothetical protein [Aequorivita sp. KMM 9714]NGX85382.1 hypothetical protein [Aequorivita sp. KMM 9714]
MERNEFAKVMAEHSDSQLIKIVTAEREKYQPLAIAAAEYEINKRKLTVQEIKLVETKIEQDLLGQKQKEIQPLGAFQKILFFVFFWGIIPWMIAATYKTDGYFRKYREAWNAMKYGLIFWLILSLLIWIIVFIAF